MKKLLSIAIALPLTLFPIVGCAHPYYPPPTYAPPPPGVVARQGFDAGVDAARRDIAMGRWPDVDRHQRFRNPPMPPGQPAQIFRDNFRRGYDSTYRSRR